MTTLVAFLTALSTALENACIEIVAACRRIMSALDAEMFPHTASTVPSVRTRARRIQLVVGWCLFALGFLGILIAKGNYPRFFSLIMAMYCVPVSMGLRAAQICDDEARLERYVAHASRAVGRLERGILLLIAAAVVIHSNPLGIRDALADALPWLPVAADGLLDFVNGVVEEAVMFVKNGLSAQQ